MPWPLAVPGRGCAGGVRAPVTALQAALVCRMPGISGASCAYRCVSPLPSPSALAALRSLMSSSGNWYVPKHGLAP